VDPPLALEPAVSGGSAHTILRNETESDAETIVTFLLPPGAPIRPIFSQRSPLCSLRNRQRIEAGRSWSGESPIGARILVSARSTRSVRSGFRRRFRL
jgi:hypothetical protein